MFSMMKPKRKSHSTGTDIGGSSEQCMLEKMIKKNTALDFFKSFWYVQKSIMELRSMSQSIRIFFTVRRHSIFKAFSWHILLQFCGSASLYHRKENITGPANEISGQC